MKIDFQKVGAGLMMRACGGEVDKRVNITLVDAPADGPLKSVYSIQRMVPGEDPGPKDSYQVGFHEHRNWPVCAVDAHGELSPRELPLLDSDFFQ